MGLVEKLHVIFNIPKINSALLSVNEEADSAPNIKTLKRLCVTRLVQSYNALNDFYDLLPFVIDTLNKNNKIIIK